MKIKFQLYLQFTNIIFPKKYFVHKIKTKKKKMKRNEQIVIETKK